MRSFEQVIEEYSRKYSGGSSNSVARLSLSRQVAADLQYLFMRKSRWNHYHRSVELDLWGTEDITVGALTSGSLVTMTSGSFDNKWIGQDINFGDTQGTFTILRKNTDTSFIIDPAYSTNFDAVASGTTVTIRQRRIGAPANIGRILDPVTFDNNRVGQFDPSALNDSWKFGNTTGGTRMMAFHGGFIEIWPAEQGRLSFQFSFMPEDMFRYDEGQAHVKSERPRSVLGMDLNSVSTKWNRLPNVGRGFVFEAQDDIVRGMPYPYEVKHVDGKNSLTIDKDYDGSLDSSFRYVISTDISTPPYMDLAILKMADRYAGNATEQQVEISIMNAISTDEKHEQLDARNSYDWASSVTAGGITNYVVRV